MLANAPSMFDQLGLARGFIRCVNRLEVGGHRCLRVDHHAFAAWQAHQIGPQGAVFGIDVHLLVEIAILRALPAISTTRRNCTSPQRPLTRGEPSAFTRLDVSRCNVCCVSASPLTCCVRPP